MTDQPITRATLKAAQEYTEVLEAENQELKEALEDATRLPDDMVPPWVRTAAYIAILADAVLSAVIIGVSNILFPDHALVVTQLVGLIGSAIGTFAGWVGVAYRPTRKG